MASGDIRDLAGGKGHVQAWVGGPSGKHVLDDLREDAYRGEPSLHDVAAMHWISHEKDGHYLNMAQEHGKSTDWRAFDHDYAFAVHRGVLEEPNQWGRDEHHMLSDPILELNDQQIPMRLRQRAAHLTYERASKMFRPLGFPPHWLAWIAAKASMLSEMETWPAIEDQRDHMALAAVKAREILGMPRLVR